MMKILDTAKLVMFDLGILLMIINIMRNKMSDKAVYRFISLGFAAGFIAETVSRYIHPGNTALFCLSVIGFMLSYTAFVFTFDVKGIKNENF
mgnify:CR=1 FL=1